MVACGTLWEGSGDVTVVCGSMVWEKPSLGTCWAKGPRRVSQREDGGDDLTLGLHSEE